MSVQVKRNKSIGRESKEDRNYRAQRIRPTVIKNRELGI
jgi:hypothetical protein